MDEVSQGSARHAGAQRLGRRQWRLALLLVTACAIAMRWYYLSHAMVYQPIRGDAIQYHAYAWNLVHHGVFSKATPGSASVTGDSFRDPGYPLFLAFWMKLFGDGAAWYVAVLLSQGLLGAITVPLLMGAARGWLPDRWSVGAGVLMALWPHSVTITSFLLSETVFGFLCAFAFFLLARALRRHSATWMPAAGLGFGLAASTNAVLVPFAALLAAWLLMRRRLGRQLALVLAIASLALPLAWGVRNLQLPAGASASGRALTNLVQGSWPDYQSGYIAAVMGDPRGRQIMQAIDHETNLMLANTPAGLQMVAQRMASAPLHYLAWYLGKPALLWDWSIRMGQGDIYVYPTVHSPFNDNPGLRGWVAVCHALNPLLMLFALGGGILALRRGHANDPIGSAIGLLALYVTLLYSILQAEPRYAIPFRGFELLLAVYGASRLTAWLAIRRNAAVRPDLPT